MKKTFTQGSILENIRSEKYSNIRCKGILITARCDIANRKVKVVHFLTALSMGDWLLEVIVPEIISERRKQLLDKIKGYATKYKLDYETIIGMDYGNAETVFISYERKTSKQKEISNLIDEWKCYDDLMGETLNQERKKEILNEYGADKLKSKISPLYKYNYPKYCFIPSLAYDEKGSLADGLVVDLQDIHQITINEAEEIENYKYDFKEIKDPDKRKAINQKFFFENEDDFVIMDDVVRSPWNERLLQEFSFLFSRIGVENANDKQIVTHCRKIVGE